MAYFKLIISKGTEFRTKFQSHEEGQCSYNSCLFCKSEDITIEKLLYEFWLNMVVEDDLDMDETEKSEKCYKKVLELVLKNL